MLKYKIPQIVTLIQEIFELSQLEENKPIYIGDKQERRCIVHYDTPSFSYIPRHFQRNSRETGSKSPEL